MISFEDIIPIGKTFISQGRTIGEGDLVMLANLTWNITSLHTDREYMKKTLFGDIILDGPSLLSCATGLSHRGGYDQMVKNIDGIRNVGNLGYDQVRFLAPVKPGDTITVHTTVSGARPSAKNPKRGIITLVDEVYNQRGEKVMRDLRFIMIEATSP